MKIAIIGTGYVGLPSGVGFAEQGNEVICIDKSAEKINKLQNGELTLYEDGLEALYKSNTEAGRLKFTTSMKDGVENADLVIIAVGTPPHPVTKEADLQYIEAASRELAQYLNGYTVVATKSTVPVGTGDKVEAIIREVNPTADVDVISLPEFLREGFAIHDFFSPDRIIAGTDSRRAKELISTLYKPFKEAKLLFVSRRSSEAIKYASNAFLAVKINYINEMANFCEKANANIDEVAAGMGLDSRIGAKFLKAGPGYGGSCFPKDTHAMAYMARQVGVTMNLIEVTIAENEKRYQLMADKIMAVSGSANAKIAVLGLAFKDGTDDCRTSPAVHIVEALLKNPVQITAYDPKAMDSAQKLLGERIAYANSAYEAVENADVIAVLTEWKDFRLLDMNKLGAKVRRKVIMDCRNLLEPLTAKNAGFKYYSIGRIND